MYLIVDGSAYSYRSACSPRCSNADCVAYAGSSAMIVIRRKQDSLVNRDVKEALDLRSVQVHRLPSATV
jgi:hypothetical protein